jgi:hypothetical protein
MNLCPRCAAPAVPGQEYCLECGMRLTESRFGLSREPSRWALRAAIAGVVALAGAAVAVAASGGSSGDSEVITATGGFATAPPSSTLPSSPDSGSGTTEWPAGEDGWTVALASLPQTGGRQVALARARKARARGLPQVGVLDSSRYASLHPGYWIVFTGIYSSEAEATSAVETARRFARTATVRRVVS